MERTLVFFTLILISTVFSQRNCKTSENLDPCFRFGKAEIPYVQTRHPSIRYSLETSDVNKFCDLHALDNGIWYISDFNITQTCVQQESCGSRFPIWLNGSIPSPAEGAVNRSGCVRTFDGCCEDTYNLMVKNCEYYNVYCFLDLPNGCPQRYCFDIDLTRFPATTTTTTTTTTKTTTKMTMPLSSAGKRSNNEADTDKNVIVGLAATLALSVSSTVLLAGFLVILKRKLASSVLPSAVGASIPAALDGDVIQYLCDNFSSRIFYV